MTEKQEKQMDAEVDRMRQIIRRKHYSYDTEKTYCHWVRRYIAFLCVHNRRDQTPEEKFEAFLTVLAREGCAASTQNQAFNAVRFYLVTVRGTQLGDINALRAKRGKRIRTAPTLSQVKQLLRLVQDVHGYPTQLICWLLYGCGLRVNEPLNLRIKDVDIENSQLMIREAKGDKDRVVNLPCVLTHAIARQMAVARKFYELDRERKIPVVLPGRLDKKYPAAPFSWAWYWLFPLQKPSVHPRTKELVRWHVLDASVQKAVREAAKELGYPGILTPHNLRHAYATHLLNSGTPIHALAESMGHESIETTAGYSHATALSVPSPLDRLLIMPAKTGQALCSEDAEALPVGLKSV